MSKWPRCIVFHPRSEAPIATHEILFDGGDKWTPSCQECIDGLTTEGYKVRSIKVKVASLINIPGQGLCWR